LILTIKIAPAPATVRPVDAILVRAARIDAVLITRFALAATGRCAALLSSEIGKSHKAQRKKHCAQHDKLATKLENIFHRCFLHFQFLEIKTLGRATTSVFCKRGLAYRLLQFYVLSVDEMKPKEFEANGRLSFRKGKPRRAERIY
jgi:hypothetical protein